MNFQQQLSKLATPTASQFVFYATLLSTLLLNISLFSFVVENVDIATYAGFAIFFSVLLIVFMLSYILNTLMALISPSLFKVFLLFTTLINASAIYYMSTFNVVLDRAMMGNIFNTRYSEAIELFSITWLMFIVVLGMVPVWLISKIKVSAVNRLRTLLNMFVVVALSFSFIYFNASSWLWIDKYASVLGGKILPWSYIINTSRHFSQQNKSTKGQEALPDGAFKDGKKTVVVLVIGETARSANFSLYGYEKQTNPKLEQIQRSGNLLVLNDPKACTTYTTGSIACMLSATENTSKHEALPSYLHRQGAEVIWRANNWGEPAIVVDEYVESTPLREQCEQQGSSNDCHLDGRLLVNLKERILTSKKQKVLVVLHTKGSHGPSYYARYTPKFEQFTPVCKSEEISKCSSEELVNAYDNTILYTDDFLARIVNTLNDLSDNSDIPTAMMYVSDHGESLGEHGLYLHGTPYSIAPDLQKDVPFLLWMSSSLQAQKGLSLTEAEQADSHSLFNVFHTLLGLLSFESDVYQEELDVVDKAKANN